jgi:hypothetical protein
MPRTFPADALNFEVEMVNVVDAAPPDGVTVAGEKLQPAWAGNPEQLKETAELNAFSGVMEIDVVPLWPPVMVRAVGVAETAKSGAGRLMV